MLMRIVLAFIAAVIATALLGTVVQTQINLADLARMGVSVPMDVRMQTTSDDLLGFTPTLAGLALIAMLIAFPVAAWIGRRAPGARTLMFSVAGAVGLYVAFILVDRFAPMPTLIAATRQTSGALLVAASGLLGGALFARFTRARPNVEMRTTGRY